MTEVMTATMNTAITIPTVDIHEPADITTTQMGPARVNQRVPMTTKEKILITMNTLGPIALEKPLALKEAILI